MAFSENILAPGDGSPEIAGGMAEDETVTVEHPAAPKINLEVDRAPLSPYSKSRTAGPQVLALEGLAELGSTSLADVVAQATSKNREVEPKTKAQGIWSKISKNKVKVIKFLEEENEQEHAKILQELVDDYRSNGKVSSNRQLRVQFDEESNRYLCPVCREKFVRESNLMSHVELVHLLTSSDKASRIRERRFGFENRSKKIAARIEQVYKSITSNDEPLSNLLAFTIDSPESPRSRQAPRAERERRKEPRRVQSPLAIAVTSLNPGRNPDDEAEDKFIRGQIEDLARQSRKGASSVSRRRVSLTTSRTGSIVSVTSDGYGTPLPRPQRTASSVSGTSCASDALGSPSRSPRLLRTGSVSSLASGPLGSPLVSRSRVGSFMNLEDMDGLDFVPPVGDRALCESWDTYLPDYIKSAGSKERHQKLQRMIHQSPTGSSYVSMRYKMPDLFADVIASYSEEETSNEWGLYSAPPPKTPSVRALSREEARQHLVNMELKNYDKTLAWLDVPNPDDGNLVDPNVDDDSERKVGTFLGDRGTKESIRPFGGQVTWSKFDKDSQGMSPVSDAGGGWQGVVGWGAGRWVHTADTPSRKFRHTHTHQFYRGLQLSLHRCRLYPASRMHCANAHPLPAVITSRWLMTMRMFIGSETLVTRVRLQIMSWTNEESLLLHRPRLHYVKAVGVHPALG
jgi:hypothetical protein